MLRRKLLACLTIALAWAIGGCRPSVPSAPPPGHLRVVTWNLEWFPGRVQDPTLEQQNEHMAAAQKAVQDFQPHLLLLQEVRDWAAVDRLSSVIPALDVHVVSRFGGHPQNQAIVSSLPADSAWAASWKHAPIDPPRGYAFAALSLPNRRFLLCYSLHLKSNLGELKQNIAMRTESTRQLLRHVSEMLALYGKRGQCAVIVAGDMNTSLDDPRFEAEPTLRALRAAGFYWTHESVPMARRTTIPGNDRFPANCFDHVFTLGLPHSTAAVQVYEHVSDHYPVLIDIDIGHASFQSRIDIAAGEKVLSSAPAIAEPRVAPGILHANDDRAIRAAIGQIATVRGKVTRVGVTESGSITFIDFAGNERGQFVGIVRRNSLTNVAAPHGGDLHAGLVNRTVEIRGKLELYRNTPEIVVSHADQLRVVSP